MQDFYWIGYRLSILISGMQIEPGMDVLDFGAGPCWLSKLLNQAGVGTISLDCSQTALKLGRQLFQDYPIIGEYVREPRFLLFDGRNIELPDRSVDRIICFDAFHHIPNQLEVLQELCRVLKEGGIVGFSEPEGRHSQAEADQEEMRDFHVLENDMWPDEIFKQAKTAGLRAC